MGGNKNTNTSAVNGSRPTDDSKLQANDINNIPDENYVTIRINKSHLFGAGCALFGALLVISMQKFMGAGSRAVQHQFLLNKASRHLLQAQNRVPFFTRPDRDIHSKKY